MDMESMQAFSQSRNASPAQAGVDLRTKVTEKTAGHAGALNVF
jgi:hypothetical protein